MREVRTGGLREVGKKMLYGEWGYVWLGNMVDLDNLTGNGTWGSNRDINIFTVNYGTTLVF